jgi:hypothetical protein
MSQAQKSGTPINLTSSAIVANAPGNLLGFYVNNTNVGTIVLRDGILSTSTAISGTITPAIGWRRFPAACPNGLYATIGGVALDVTFIYAAG